MIPTTKKMMTIVRHIIAAEFLVATTLLCLEAPPNSFASEPPRSRIQGTVNDFSAHVDRIQILAYLLRTPNGSPAFAMECQTTTDTEGHYTCPRVTPGRYILLANPHSKAPAIPKGDMPSSTFYPGTSEIEQAELVDVRPNRLNIFNFSLQMIPLFQISGDIEGKPKSADLELYYVDNQRGFKLDSGQFVKYDETTGGFTVGGAADGQYLLTGVWRLPSASNERSYPELSEMGSTEVSIADGDRPNLVLRSKPLTALDGQIEFDGEQPGRSFHLELQDVEDRQKQYETIVDRSGRFHFTNLPCGAYQIMDLNVTGAYVATVHIGGTSLASDQFVIPCDPHVELDVSASLHSKTISGTVADWDSGDSHVYVLARNELNGDVQTTKTNQYGQFSIGGLAPGEYDLYAWTSLGGIAYETRYGLTPFENNKVAVSTDDISAGEAAVPLAEAATH